MSTVAVRKFAVGTQAVRSRASVRGVAENCRTAGCKTALTAGKQTGKIERHLLHGKVAFFCKSLNPAKTMPKSKVFAEMENTLIFYSAVAIMTLDKNTLGNYNGIKVLYLLDWLLAGYSAA